MPKHLKRLQFKTDSIRARQWFELRKDSSYIRKYISTTVSPVNDNTLPLQPAAPVRPYASQTWLAVLPDNRNTYSTQPVARNRA
jgi:penicillin-binding protein 2